MAKKKNTEDFNPQDEAVAEGEHIPHDALEESAEYAEKFGAPFASPILPQPSQQGNPYLSEEDQFMEMKPAVVGPPAYGSPDPVTSAGKLLPLNQHPLNAAALPKDHPAAIDEDYGVGYDYTLQGGRPERTDLERHLAGDRTNEGNEEVEATEGARELANEQGVDLNDVEGTGQDGRVTKQDVEDYLSQTEDNE